MFDVGPRFTGEDCEAQDQSCAKDPGSVIKINFPAQVERRGDSYFTKQKLPIRRQDEAYLSQISAMYNAEVRQTWDNFDTLDATTRSAGCVEGYRGLGFSRPTRSTVKNGRVTRMTVK